MPDAPTRIFLASLCAAMARRMPDPRERKALIESVQEVTDGLAQQGRLNHLSVGQRKRFWRMRQDFQLLLLETESLLETGE